MTPPAQPPAAKDSLVVRPLQHSDRQALLDIYNHYVEHSHCTFDITPLSLVQRQPWFDQFSDQGRYQCQVLLAGEDVLGYACSIPFKVKPAYQTSVEVSVYCKADTGTQSGWGTLLYQHLFAALASQPIHRAYAGIALPNPASAALHRKFSFTQVGCYQEVGFKFDRYWDVAWFEKRM